MSGYVLSIEAEEDVFRIWEYLTNKADLKTANRVEARLYKAFELLTKTPGLGHRRPDLTKYPVLFFRVRPYAYLIIYRPEVPLEIVGILHGRRNIAELLYDRLP